MEEAPLEGQKKCVMVLDGELPIGLAVNAAGVLAVTLGRRVEEIVGPDVADGSGDRHAGLVTIPISILKAGTEAIEDIRRRALGVEGLLVVGLTDAAQTSKTYEEYEERMAASDGEDLRYLGLALHSDKKPVNKLTGSLSLLR